MIMKLWTLVLLWCSLMYVDSSLFGSKEKPKWETLKVTWGVPYLNANAFWKVPFTVQEATDVGFTKISTDCEGKFHGYRYIIGNDTGLVLLFDENGRVAGIQSAFPKDSISPSTKEEWFKKTSMFVEDNINGIDTYTLTAYLVKPDTICKKQPEDSNANPIGTQLSIQNKPTFLEIPMEEENLVKDPVWIKGKCFPSMGMHYWYNMTKDLDCDYLMPIFLLYNKHTLTGLGWAIPNVFTSSNRFEHPPKFTLSQFLDPVPDCLLQDFDKAGGFTTMHMYMNTDFNFRC